MNEELSVIILAAGKGTRMKSDLAKVLHPALGRPLIHWVLDQAEAAGAGHKVVVVGHQREAVIESVQERGVTIAVQEQQLGTGHAVQVCREAMAGHTGQVLILSGDVPLLSPGTLRQLHAFHVDSSSAATILTAEFDDPTGYGRIIRHADGKVLKIVEHKDAQPKELAVREINSGIYLFDVGLLFEYIGRLDTDNAQGELYLTDVVRLLVEDGHPVGALCTPHQEEIQGVNTVEQLREVENQLGSR